ncbi:hypothetical protein EVAR_38131_1 [Eumeta japonica]|uniref:Uncharacterized protein n=1 Tax=Eumeta variegata TaxID=151549 RepID=A0A4C1YQP5_EUMVA|nr:hypothetical protein EVAR_38131_1 [Eumeta japonica]
MLFQHDAKHLTEVLRMSPISEFRAAGGLAHSARMCDAQAVAGVVLMVARSLLYNEVWRLSGFVDTTYSIITPTRFIANAIELGYTGVTRCFDIPKMSDYEMNCVDIALMEMQRRRAVMEEWYCKYCCCWDKCVCAS